MGCDLDVRRVVLEIEAISVHLVKDTHPYVMSVSCLVGWSLPLLLDPQLPLLFPTWFVHN